MSRRRGSFVRPSAPRAPGTWAAHPHQNLMFNDDIISMLNGGIYIEHFDNFKTLPGFKQFSFFPFHLFHFHPEPSFIMFPPAANQINKGHIWMTRSELRFK